MMGPSGVCVCVRAIMYWFDTQNMPLRLMFYTHRVQEIKQRGLAHRFIIKNLRSSTMTDQYDQNMGGDLKKINSRTQAT